MTSSFADPVYISAGPQYDDGELIERADLPADAYQSAMTISGEDVDGGDPADEYEVWVVERPDGDSDIVED